MLTEECACEPLQVILNEEVSFQALVQTLSMLSGQLLLGREFMTNSPKGTRALS